MNDLISRQAAIRETWREPTYFDPLNVMTEMRDRLKALPSAEPEPEPELDEWCTDCKEYDQERHCCPRWNRVIRQTLKDVENKIVRCKDCKHLFDGEYNAKCCELLMGRAKWLTEITVDMNWYCTDGERRTDETD